MKRYKLPIDRRGRTPLHSICAGFRTTSNTNTNTSSLSLYERGNNNNRPKNIYLLLKYDPKSVLLQDEKGKTSFSLIYDDYAEEVEEFLIKRSNTNRLNLKNVNMNMTGFYDWDHRDDGTISNNTIELVLVLLSNNNNNGGVLCF